VKLRAATFVLLLASVLQHAGGQSAGGQPAGIQPAAAQPAGAQPAATDDQGTVAAIERTLIEVIHRAEPSVVAVARLAPAQQSLLAPRAGDLFADLRQQSAANEPNIVAAGVIIDPAGLILTEYLAIREGEQHTITTVDGKIYPATIKAADPRSGLAILAISAPASPLKRASATTDKAQQSTQFHAISFGDASQLRKGQFVISIGNPYAIRSDGEPTASWGIVTNLARKAPAGANLNDAPGPNGDYRTTLHHLGTLIQTDAKLGWSAGGGALINLRGELIGLTTTVATIAGHEQPAGYAIPIDETTRRIIDTLKQGREAEYGLLGIGFQPANPAAAGAANAGATVQQVYPGSPAARAGLQTNDVITQVAGQSVSDVDRLQLTVSRLVPSQKVPIDYVRGGHAATAQVTLSKLAVAGKKIVTDRPPGWRGIRVDYALALDAATLSEKSAAGALDPEGCVVVTDVAQDSPAWQAGVRPGMFISHVGDKRVTTPDEFRAAMQDAGRGVSVRLTQPIRGSNDSGGTDLEIPLTE
jgi:serine protease Do